MTDSFVVITPVERLQRLTPTPQALQRLYNQLELMRQTLVVKNSVACLNLVADLNVRHTQKTAKNDHRAISRMGTDSRPSLRI